MPNAFLFFNQRNHVSVTRHVSLGRELYGVIDFCVCGGPYLFLGQNSKVELFFLLFWFFHCEVGGSYSHHFSYIVPLDNIVPLYFDWLLVLKITLWSYLLKNKKKKLCEVMIYERNATQRDNFHVIHNCHCHKLWLADKESELG